MYEIKVTFVGGDDPVSMQIEARDTIEAIQQTLDWLNKAYGDRRPILDKIEFV